MIICIKLNHWRHTFSSIRDRFKELIQFSEQWNMNRCTTGKLFRPLIPYRFCQMAYKKSLLLLTLLTPTFFIFSFFISCRKPTYFFFDAYLILLRWIYTYIFQLWTGPKSMKGISQKIAPGSRYHMVWTWQAHTAPEAIVKNF